MKGSGFSSRNLAFVGLGMMGGSLAMALRPYAETIVAFDTNPDTRKYALQHGIVDKVSDDLKEAVAEADAVILAAPVRVIRDLLRKRIGVYLRSNTLLIDIGSTKQDICDAMGQLPIGVNAIGGHPMAGKERSGIESSDSALFHNRPFVLCRTRRTTPATRTRALSLIEAVGAMPIEMDSERHDQVVAAISHLPYMLSAALVGTISQQSKKDDAVWELAATGFRDMSRLAASDISMMSDILSTNTKAVATILAMFRVQLATLEAMLISGDEQQLIDTLVPVREARLEWVEQYERKRNA